MIFAILELCGRYCGDPNKGTTLCAQIGSALERGAEVVLDFSGVRVLTGPFLNSAIGSLYGSFPADTIDRQISFTGLDDANACLVRHVQSNAQRFYALPPEQRARLLESERYLVENG